MIQSGLRMALAWGVLAGCGESRSAPQFDGPPPPSAASEGEGEGEGPAPPPPPPEGPHGEGEGEGEGEGPGAAGPGEGEGEGEPAPPCAPTPRAQGRVVTGAAELVYAGAPAQGDLGHRAPPAQDAGCVAAAQLRVTTEEAGGCAMSLTFQTPADRGGLRLTHASLDAGEGCAGWPEDRRGRYAWAGGGAAWLTTDARVEGGAAAACLEGELGMTGQIALVGPDGADLAVDLDGLSLVGAFDSQGATWLTCPCPAPFAGPACEACAEGSYGPQCARTCGDDRDPDGDCLAGDDDPCPELHADAPDADGDCEADLDDACRRLHADAADQDGDCLADADDPCPELHVERRDWDEDCLEDIDDPCPALHRDTPDDDGDCVPDDQDPCVQLHADRPDADDDCVPDDDDVCPDLHDDTPDADRDCTPDADDPCPALHSDRPDDDDDCVNDAEDGCLGVANPGQEDGDGDGRQDACDVCPEVDDADQADADEDGVGDACDNCRHVANPDQVDADNNAVGDACGSCDDRFPSADAVCFDDGRTACQLYAALGVNQHCGDFCARTGARCIQAWGAEGECVYRWDTTCDAPQFAESVCRCERL